MSRPPCCKYQHDESNQNKQDKPHAEDRLHESQIYCCKGLHKERDAPLAGTHITWLVQLNDPIRVTFQFLAGLRVLEDVAVIILLLVLLTATQRIDNGARIAVRYTILVHRQSSVLVALDVHWQPRRGMNLSEVGIAFLAIVVREERGPQSEFTSSNLLLNTLVELHRRISDLHLEDQHRVPLLAKLQRRLFGNAELVVVFLEANLSAGFRVKVSAH